MRDGAKGKSCGEERWDYSRWLVWNIRGLAIVWGKMAVVTWRDRDRCLETGGIRSDDVVERSVGMETKLIKPNILVFKFCSIILINLKILFNFDLFVY